MASACRGFPEGGLTAHCYSSDLTIDEKIVTQPKLLRRLGVEVAGHSSSLSCDLIGIKLIHGANI